MIHPRKIERDEEGKQDGAYPVDTTTGACFDSFKGMFNSAISIYLSKPHKGRSGREHVIHLLGCCCKVRSAHPPNLGCGVKNYLPPFATCAEHQLPAIP